MKEREVKRALECAVAATQLAGRILTENLRKPKKIDSVERQDIKLELDVRCQKVIERKLAAEFPEVPLLGEEGSSGDMDSDYRWVVDPIDGTVNFAYQIPHACVSIALQGRVAGRGSFGDGFETLAGVVYDPFCDELWTAVQGRAARLNGRIIQVSKRTHLEEAIVSVGFAKQKETVEEMLPKFNALVHRVRKVRLMGAAALGLVYVASGRFDAYLEAGIRLWDIAAGGLILESAGGEFRRRSLGGQHRFRINANNGVLGKKIERL